MASKALADKDSNGITWESNPIASGGDGANAGGAVLPDGGEDIELGTTSGRQQPKRFCRPAVVFTALGLVIATVAVGFVIVAMNTSTKARVDIPHVRGRVWLRGIPHPPQHSRMARWCALFLQTFTASFSSDSTSGFDGDLVGAGVSSVSGTLHKTQSADGTWQLSGVATVVTHSTQITKLTVVDNRAYLESFHVDDGVDGQPLEQGCARETTLDGVSQLATSIDNVRASAAASAAAVVGAVLVRACFSRQAVRLCAGLGAPGWACCRWCRAVVFRQHRTIRVPSPGP